MYLAFKKSKSCIQNELILIFTFSIRHKFQNVNFYIIYPWKKCNLYVKMLTGDSLRNEKNDYLLSRYYCINKVRNISRYIFFDLIDPYCRPVRESSYHLYFVKLYLCLSLCSLLSIFIFYGGRELTL